MSNKKKKRSSTSTPPDLISYLPDNVTDNILVHLPLRDAARTSVLSKKWRHAWITLPQLVFDGSFGGKLSMDQRRVAIYQILLLHRGPILKFTFSIFGLGDGRDVYHIIQFLSRNRIQDLAFRFTKRYKIPPCLFSCLELRHLHLSYCSIKPPATFNGFEKLTSLKFLDVDCDAEDIANITSKCPLLEMLTLGIRKSVDHLNIYAPNLKELCIYADFNSINLRDSPFLRKVVIAGSSKKPPDVSKGGRIDILETLGCLLGSVEHLEIGFRFLAILAAGDVPTRLSTDFTRLETIFFQDICFQEMSEVSCALCLIRSSPHLKKIGLTVHEGNDDANVVEFLEFQNKSDLSLSELEEVKLLYFRDSNPEIEFVKLILNKSPLLKRLFIHTHQDINADGELRILKKMIRLHRASKLAEIVYSSPDEEIS